MAAELELGLDLATVEVTARHDLTRLDGDGDDVACKARVRPGGDGRCHRHAVRGEAHQHDGRLMGPHEGLDRGGIDVCVELVRGHGDVDDEVHAIERRSLHEHSGVRGEQRDGERPQAGFLHLLAGRHRLTRRLAELSVQVLRYDHDALAHALAS